MRLSCDQAAAGNQSVALQTTPSQLDAVITAVDGQTIHHFDDLTTYLFTKTKVGQTITLSILRNGKAQDVKVTLAARPTNTTQQ